jgi:uncharacterized membrane protein
MGDMTEIWQNLIVLAIIAAAILFATLRYLIQSALPPGVESRYQELKISLGKTLLLGLEILVAADIVRTVALEATIQSVTVLGMLVLIRTFLSWALVVELVGRWPWQTKRET